MNASNRVAAPKSAATPTSASRGSAASATTQLKSAVRGSEGFAAQEAMMRPRDGGGSPLPGAVQAKMESAFGADFGGVRVHQSGQPEAIGAKAFARGNDIHFASGQYAPGSGAGQELLGHELAHVVQQRQGRVAPTMQAKGGRLGINADPSLEAEADVLGAKAARGERVGGGGGSSVSGPGVVQGLFTVDPQQALAAFGHDFDGVAMRVADDGTMAAPAGEDVKHFYATKDHIKSSNKVLEGANSQFRLESAGGGYDVRSAKNKEVSLHKVIGTAPSRQERGDDLSGGPNCNEMGLAVMGHGKVKESKQAVRGVKGTGMTTDESSSTGMDLFRHTTNVANGDSRKDSERNVKRYNDQRTNRKQVEKQDTAHVMEVKYTDAQGARGRVADILMRFNGENRKMGRFEAQATLARYYLRASGVATFEQKLRLLEDDMRNNRPDCIESVTDSGETMQMSFGEIDTTQNEDEDNLALDAYDQLQDVDREKAHKKIGLDTHANPEVGEAYSIVPVVRPGSDESVDFPYHWAGVVAKSGGDNVTLENYAGRTADGVYFTMYGPQTKVDVAQDSITKAQDQGTKDDKESTTFHGQWKQTFPGVHTITHATKMTEKKG